MQTLPIRVLRNEPGRFEEILSGEGMVLLSKDGEPLAIAIDVLKSGLEEIVRLVAQIRVQLAVSEMRAQAQARSLDDLTPEQIDAEIRAVRSKRKK